MKIRFQPRRGSRELELRDLKGGTEFSLWRNGQEREIPIMTVPFQSGPGPAQPLDLATAIFRHGPDFVDAATGKNPLYSCADCGSEALEEYAFDYFHNCTMPFVDDVGKRLCVACWLGRHPEQIVSFRLRGYGDDVILKAQALAAKRNAPAAVAARPADEEKS